MKRMIVAAGLVWVSIYTVNHMLPASLPKEGQVAIEQDERATDHMINSWGPYLPHVKPPASHLTKSAPQFAHSRELASSMQKVGTSQVDAVIARVTASEHFSREGTPSIYLSENKALTAVDDLKPNTKVATLDEPAFKTRPFKNAQTAPAKETSVGKLPAQRLDPNSNPVTSTEPMNIATLGPLPRRVAAPPSPPRRTAKIATRKEPTTSRRSSRQTESRVAQVVQKPIGSKSKGGNAGLFMFAPAGF